MPEEDSKKLITCPLCAMHWCYYNPISSETASATHIPQEPSLVKARFSLRCKPKIIRRKCLPALPIGTKAVWWDTPETKTSLIKSAYDFPGQVPESIPRRVPRDCEPEGCRVMTANKGRGSKNQRPLWPWSVISLLRSHRGKVKQDLVKDSYTNINVCAHT